MWISNKLGADPDRVTFYVNQAPDGETPDTLVGQDGDLVGDDSDLRAFASVDDSISLDVGECVCVGIQVYAMNDDGFDITRPSAGDELLSGVELVADIGPDACRDG